MDDIVTSSLIGAWLLSVLFITFLMAFGDVTPYRRLQYGDIWWLHAPDCRWNCTAFRVEHDPTTHYRLTPVAPNGSKWTQVGPSIFQYLEYSVDGCTLVRPCRGSKWTLLERDGRASAFAMHTWMGRRVRQNARRIDLT